MPSAHFMCGLRRLTHTCKSESIEQPLARIRFLERIQRRDGAFVPLWFGNEQGQDDQNPVYGTAQVLIALNELSRMGLAIPEQIRLRAADFLASAQHENGGWGGDKNLPETVEETALALEAMCAGGRGGSVERALNRLLQLIEEGRHETASPIGFYFARLWYYERHYPVVFTISALKAVGSVDK